MRVAWSLVSQHEEAGVETFGLFLVVPCAVMPSTVVVTVVVIPYWWAPSS